MKAMAVLLNDENTVKRSHMFDYKKVGGICVGTVFSFFTKLGERSDSNAGVIGFCRADLWRADGALLKKLIVLQHALKHKEGPERMKETRKINLIFSFLMQVSVSPSDC